MRKRPRKIGMPSDNPLGGAIGSGNNCPTQRVAPEETTYLFGLGPRHRRYLRRDVCDVAKSCLASMLLPQRRATIGEPRRAAHRRDLQRGKRCRCR